MFNYLKKHNMRNSLKMLLCLTAICVFSNNAAAKICFLPDGNCGKTKININSGENGCIYKDKGAAETGMSKCEIAFQRNSCWWRRCNSDNKTIFDKLADCQKKIEDATKQECQACGSCYKLVPISIPQNACSDGYSTKYQSPSDCGDNESFSKNGTYNGKVCGACIPAKTCPSGYSTQYQSQKDCLSGETFSSSGSVGNLTCGKCETTNKTCKEINPNYVNDEEEDYQECHIRTGHSDIDQEMFEAYPTGITATDGNCLDCHWMTCKEANFVTSLSECPNTTDYLLTKAIDGNTTYIGSDGQCYECITKDFKVYTNRSDCYGVYVENYKGYPTNGTSTIDQYYMISKDSTVKVSTWRLFDDVKCKNTDYTLYINGRKFSAKNNEFILNDEFIKKYNVEKNSFNIRAEDELRKTTYTAEFYLENDDCPDVDGICPSAGIVVDDASDDEYMKDVSVDVVMSIDCCGEKDRCTSPYPSVIFNGKTWWNYHYTTSELCSYNFGTSEFRIYKKSKGGYIATIKGFGCASVNDGTIDICMTAH